MVLDADDAFMLRNVTWRYSG